jgi:hypothetical protein
VRRWPLEEPARGRKCYPQSNLCPLLGGAWHRGPGRQEVGKQPLGTDFTFLQRTLAAMTGPILCLPGQATQKQNGAKEKG